MRTTTASPGATSRSISKPSVLQTTLSEAITRSVKPSASLVPMNSGRMPFGSRKATTPQPVITVTTL